MKMRMCFLYVLVGLVVSGLCSLLPAACHAVSEALSVDELNETPLAMGLIKFNTETVGRPLQSGGWIAVEQYFLTLSGYPGVKFSVADMLALESQSVISDSTTVLMGYRRALVEGDSATVAQAIAGGQINWAISEPEDAYPTNPIIPELGEPRQ